MTFRNNVDNQLKYITPLYEEAATEYKFGNWSYPNSKQKKILEIINPLLLELKETKIQDLALIFAYLTIPNRHFRSGYNKEKILHYLKKYQLTQEQKEILKEIFNNTKTTLSRREINKWKTLLKTINSNQEISNQPQ